MNPAKLVGQLAAFAIGGLFVLMIAQGVAAIAKNAATPLGPGDTIEVNQFVMATKSTRLNFDEDGRSDLVPGPKSCSLWEGQRGELLALTHNGQAVVQVLKWYEVSTPGSCTHHDMVRVPLERLRRPSVSI